MDSELIIVGLDPGTTVGISFISIDSSSVFSYSQRNLKPDETLKRIISYGFPIAVATDKKKAPSAVKDAAVSLNLKLIMPDHDLTLKEKYELISEFEKKEKKSVILKNSHERDSFASAIYAYKKSRQLITKLRNSFEGLNGEQKKKLVIESFRREVAIENIKRKIIKEENFAADKAGSTKSGNKNYRQTARPQLYSGKSRKEEELIETTKELYARIEGLEKKNSKLKKENSRLKKKIRNQKLIIKSYTQSAGSTLKEENIVALKKSSDDKLIRDAAILIDKLEGNSISAIKSDNGKTYFSENLEEYEDEELSVSKKRTLRLETLHITLYENDKSFSVKKKQMGDGKKMGSEILDSIIDDYRAARNPEGK